MDERASELVLYCEYERADRSGRRVCPGNSIVQEENSTKESLDVRLRALIDVRTVLGFVLMCRCIKDFVKDGFDIINPKLHNVAFSQHTD